MKNILKVSLIGCAASILMSGCVSSNLAVNNNGHISANKEISKAKLYDDIMEAGSKNGWRMTEFKANEIIAENTSDKNAEAVSIHLKDGYFFTRPNNDELNKIITEALQE
jgi:hypothetical protein